ncbi:MAG: hypothetical protein U0R52_02715 [Solirubrobacterales bacterium]
MALTAATLSSAPAASAFDCGTKLDRFNRADNVLLGPSWLARAGGIGIESKRATNPLPTEGLATFKGRKAAQACLDVRTNGAGATQYVAIVLGYAGLDNNIFVKVQDNDTDGTFERAYFYRGNNGDDLVSSGASQNLGPFTAARLHLAWLGRAVKLDIDTNFDNRPEQTVGVDGVKTAGLGSGVGMGIYGHPFADDFSVAPPETKLDSAAIKRAQGKATFTFSSRTASRFECSIDGERFKACDSPSTYRGLDRGRHRFRVRARDQVGNVDPTPAQRGFSI